MNELNEKITLLKSKIKPPYLPYIDVDEGWYQLVLDCDAELSAIDPNYDLQQVKEKFGGLRFYFQPSDPNLREQMDTIVSKYEDVASKTCEATGQSGVLMKSIGNWYKTLNPDYAANTLHYAKYSPVENRK